MPSLYHQGASRTILLTEDGEQSIRDLVAVHSKEIETGLARADALIRTFAETGQLRSPDQWRKEGDGFWAIRAKQIRFYGWYEHGGIFVVSHAICKRHQKLSDADKSRMLKNQAEYRNSKK
jgi:hypothetical protein